MGVHNPLNPTSSKHDLSSLPLDQTLGSAASSPASKPSPGPASQSYRQSLRQVPPPTPPTSLTPTPPVQALTHPTASAPRRGGDATLPPPGLSASRIPSSNPPSSESSRRPQDPSRTTFFHDNTPGIKEISKKCKTIPLCPLNTFILKNAVVFHKKIFILTCSGFIVVILK